MLRAVADWLHRFWWVIPLALQSYALATAIVLGTHFLDILTPISSEEEIPGYETIFSTGADWPGLVSLWDAQWYRSIVEWGYQEDYSLESGGLTNWAFFPLFPFLVKLLTLLGLPFWLAGSLISVVSTTLASILLFRLAYSYSGSLWVGLFSVLPIFLNPAYFVTISAYSEGVGLLLLSIALFALVRRRYPLLIVSLILIGFARGIGMPLALVVGVMLLIELFKNHRLSTLQWGSLAAAAFAAGFWPLTVAYNLGSLDASLRILSQWTITPKLPLWIPPLVALIALLLHSRSRLPLEWKLWTFFYSVYITATVFSGLSVLRYALLALIPLPLYLISGSRKERTFVLAGVLILLLALGIYGQSWWLTGVWIRSPANIPYIAVP